MRYKEYAQSLFLNVCGFPFLPRKQKLVDRKEDPFRLGLFAELFFGGKVAFHPLFPLSQQRSPVFRQGLLSQKAHRFVVNPNH